MDDEIHRLWARLHKEYEPLSARVMFDRESLGQVVIEQSEDHRRAGENWVYAKRVLAHAVRDKATCWATTCTSMRGKQTLAFHDEDGPKVTDKSVENAVRGDENYLDMAFQLDEVNLLVGLYDELRQRFHGRGFRLRDLVTLHTCGRDRDHIKDEPPARSYYGPERRAESDDEQKSADESPDPEAPATTPTPRRRFRDIR